MTSRLQLVGGGRMGGALLAGLLDAGWCSADEVVVVEPDQHRRDELAAAHPGLVTAAEVVDGVGDAVIAVKPGVVADVAAALGRAGTRRVLSIAAGVTTSTIAAAVPTGCAVLRAMPNTPALVGAGASAVCAGPAASDDDLTWAVSILSAVGIAVRVDESRLDAVTGLSGSGPAYVFLVAEALIEAGVLNGLDRPTATALAVQTLSGASRLLAERPDDAAGLRAEVTSPGGTTAAGLRALEAAGFRAALLEAVSAATRRSAELSGE